MPQTSAATAAPARIPVRQSFWRDPALPFIEARYVEDGRGVCYDRHSHDCFSIGAITGGSCTYLNGQLCERVGKGSVVLMNPGEVHACSPLAGNWSYLMLYVDIDWLAALQEERGIRSAGQFRPLNERLNSEPQRYRDLGRLHATLVTHANSLIEKEVALHDFFAGLIKHTPSSATRETGKTDSRLLRAADFIRCHCSDPLRLEDICRAAEISASFLIRAFKAHYTMTPHEYLTQCRIQHCRARLRKGETLAQVAAETGFADQAHFQRAFKRYVAATPGEYRAAGSA